MTGQNFSFFWRTPQVSPGRSGDAGSSILALPASSAPLLLDNYPVSAGSPPKATHPGLVEGHHKEAAGSLRELLPGAVQTASREL